LTAFGHVITAISLAVTIIGISFAWAHLKLSGIAMADRHWELGNSKKLSRGQGGEARALLKVWPGPSDSQIPAGFAGGFFFCFCRAR